MHNHSQPLTNSLPEGAAQPAWGGKLPRERTTTSQRAAALRKTHTRAKANRRTDLSASRNSKFSTSWSASNRFVSSSSNSDDSDIGSEDYDVSVSSISGLDAYDSEEEENESFADQADVVVSGVSPAAQAEAAAGDQEARSEEVSAQQVPRSNPAFESYVSLILHLEIQDVPALDIGSSVKASVTWTCVESNEVGLLPKFLLQISTGLEVEYSPSSGLLSGRAADGTALRYEFGSRQDHAQGKTKPHGLSANTRTDDKLRVLIKFCQCLALRAMQLRKQALLLETNKLPMVHYDTLPESLLSSFRQPSLDALLHRSLTVKDQEEFEDDQLSDARSSAEISGVGRGYLGHSGDLRIVFLDGSELILDADGSQLRFQPSNESSADDFRLLTGSNTSAFLPSAVKKRLESVPDFIRKLKSLKAI